MKDEALKNAVPADAGLDEALAQIAEEVPPMPADFHDRWMNAVRAEAGKTAPAAEDNGKQDRTVSLVRWTRILSVAAVFVFLIGGTLLYRNSKKSLSFPYAAEEREAPAPAEAVNAAMPAAEEAVSEEAPVMMDSYLQADAGEAEEEASRKAAGAEMNVFAAAAKEASDSMITEGAVMEEAAEAEYDAAFEMEDAAEEPAATIMPTAVPTATAAPAAAPEPTEEPAQESGFLQETGAFFTDMGDFLLAALPYLLVLAVPAAAALVIRRKRRGS